MGDLLFAVVNFARKKELDAEQLLNQATAKFAPVSKPWNVWRKHAACSSIHSHCRRWTCCGTRRKLLNRRSAAFLVCRDRQPS